MMREKDEPKACAGSFVHPLGKRSFEKRENKENMGVNGKRERAFLLGRDAVSQSEGTPDLVCKVLKTQTACEKTLSTFLSNANERRTTKGKGSSCLRSSSLNYTIIGVI
jgi:hypothetical protein